MKRSPKGSFLIFDSSSSPSPSVMLCSLNPLLSETMASVHLSTPLAQLQMKNTKIRSAGKFPPEAFDPERKYRSVELISVGLMQEMKEQCNEKRKIQIDATAYRSFSLRGDVKTASESAPLYAVRKSALVDRLEHL
ncbi:hypothetical protein LINPERHAP1_LOCUS43995 [Linum perenne]